MFLAHLSLWGLMLTGTLAASHDTRLRHKRSKHAELAERQAIDNTPVVHNNTLAKRAFTGRGTFYYTGLGACGQYSHDNDNMVALNSAQYGGGYPGPQCFKYITVQANGVTVGGVQILDECPTCGYGDLDLSPGLFNQFHSSNGGTVELTWWFDGEGPAPAPAPSPSPKPAPAPAPSPSPSPAWTPEPSPSPAWTPAPTSTSTYSPPPPPSSTSTWVAPSSSLTTTSTSTSTSTSTPPPSSSSSAAASSLASAVSSVYAINSTNPYAVVTNNNATSTSLSAAASSHSTGSHSPNAHSVGNLEAFNGLVANYGQLIVVGAGGA